MGAKVQSGARRRNSVKSSPRNVRRAVLTDLPPSLRLWVAVIASAIEDCQLYRGCETVATQRIFRNATKWLFRESAGFQETDFEFLCTALGLDPEYVRRLATEEMGLTTEEILGALRDGLLNDREEGLDRKVPGG